MMKMSKLNVRITKYKSIYTAKNTKANRVRQPCMGIKLEVYNRLKVMH